MEELERQLSRALHDGAHDLHVDGVGLEPTRRRARRLSARRRAVPVSVVAVTAIAGAGIVVARRDEPKSGVVAEAPSDTTVPPAVVPSDLTWRAADATLGMPRKIVHTSDGYAYALSTAPGARSEDYPNGGIPQALYRSTDGETWESVSLGEAPWMTDLTERDGVLWAVGTGPATRAGVDMDAIAATSTDGGKTWGRISLPSTATPPNATIPVTYGGPLVSIAAGNGTLVASLRTQFYIDGESLLTAEEREQAAYVTVGDEGLEVITMASDGLLDSCRVAPAADDKQFVEVCGREVGEPQPSRVISWAELGLTGPGDLTVDELFVSNDGETWEKIDSPFTSGSVTDLAATADGFVAATTTYGPREQNAQLWHSPDGRTWTAVSEQIGMIDRVGVAGSHLVAVSGTSVVTSADGGRSWTSVDVAAVAGFESEPGLVWAYPFDAGPLGIAIAVANNPTAPPAGAGEQMPEHYLLTSIDGVSWSVASLADIVGDDTYGWIDSVVVTENEIAVTVGAGRREDWKTYVGTPTR